MATSDKRKNVMAHHGATDRVHSDDAHVHNNLPMRPTRLPNDANSEMMFLGEGEDMEDGDEDEMDLED